MSEKDERTIRPCPFCKVCCGLWRVSDEEYRVICQNPGCGYQTKGRALESAVITFHNELCELVEKGRRYEEDVDERDDLIALQLRCMGKADDYYHEQTGADPKIHSDLTALLNWLTDRCKSGDEAARLLRGWRERLYLGMSERLIDKTDTFLARIDKIGG